MLSHKGGFMKSVFSSLVLAIFLGLFSFSENAKADNVHVKICVLNNYVGVPDVRIDAAGNTTTGPIRIASSTSANGCAVGWIPVGIYNIAISKLGLSVNFGTFFVFWNMDIYYEHTLGLVRATYHGDRYLR